MNEDTAKAIVEYETWYAMTYPNDSYSSDENCIRKALCATNILLLEILDALRAIVLLLPDAERKGTQ